MRVTISKAKQLVDLVRKGAISYNTFTTTKTRTYDYSDRSEVHRTIRSANVKVLRKAIRHMDLGPAKRPPYRSERHWKVGNKSELVERIYQAWEARFSEAEKAKVLIEAKQNLINQNRHQIKLLQEETAKLNNEIEELREEVL